MKNTWTFIVFLFIQISLFAQTEVNMSIMVSPPYSHALESYVEYDDRMVISIQNTTLSDLSLRFQISIEGDNGVSITTRPEYRPAVPFIIEAEDFDSFTGSEIEDIGVSIATSDLNLVGVTTNMLNQRILPEGFYTICITAYDYFTDQQLSASEPQGCASWNIEYPSAPEITSPTSGFEMDEIEDELAIIWSQSIITNSELIERVMYRVRLIDLTSQAFTNAEEAFASGAAIFDVDEELEALSVFVIQDIDWQSGHQYAVRVTAFDPDEEYLFLNSGNSNIVQFTFGAAPTSTSCDNPGDYNMVAHFPVSGDTLPFLTLPTIGEFSPHCDQYWRLDFDASCSGYPSYSDQNAWPDGPLAYIQNCIYPAATWNEAALIPFVDVTNATRGQSYSWDVETTMNTRVSGSWDADVPSTNFTVGMPKPRLIAPAHEATVPPGDVQFNFRSAAGQTKIIPDYLLYHIDGCTLQEARLSDVHEKWVLQVYNSATPSESALVNFQSSMLDVSITDLYNSSTREFDAFGLELHLVKLLDHEFNITDEGDYWWRVSWTRDPDATVTNTTPESSFYHMSNLRKFTIDEDATTTTPEEEEPTCSSPCTFPTIADRTAVGGLSIGQTFTIAGFSTEVESITGSASNRFSGQALVQISWLNNVKVRMSMENIQVNAANEAFAGKLTPILDQSYPLSEVVTPLGTALGMDETGAQALDAGLTAAGKLISLLSEGSTINLPIGIDKEIDDTRIIIGIMDIQIEPDDAKIKAVINLTLPNFEIVEGFVSLGAEVCMTNSGLADQAKLYLPQDQVFDMGSGNEFRIVGAEGGTAEEDITYVEWDCKGFKELNLSSEFQFTRDWVLPETTDGEIRETGNVEARVRGKFSRGANIMVRMDMDPFQLPGVDGWSFTVADEAWIDLSDLENPTGLAAAVPSDYVHASMETSGMEKTWKGFWLKEVSVTSPAELQGPEGDRLTFAIHNLIIDNTGISLSARAENLLRWEEEGNMAGWSVSLDAFYLDFQQNNFRQAGFNGKLGLPIADEREYLVYDASLRHRNDSFSFVFNVHPEENLTIPISMATVTIASTSYIKVELGHRSYIEANITGSLGISDENLSEDNSMPSTLNMPELRIQNLRLNSETGFDNDAFSYSLASPQKTMSNFPISLESFGIANDGIRIEPRLSLSEGNSSFAASARIVLEIDMDLMASPQRFDLTGVSLERIDIDVSTSDVTLKGYLDFYKESEAKGVRGGILIGINMGTKIEININADFGTKKTLAATNYGTEEWFSYFYVDGMVLLPGITIFSGIDLYGLGGGFYHHMRMANAIPASTSVASAGASSAPSGVRYEPHFATDLGLRFTAILGSTGDNGKAYNIDVTIGAEFSFAHGMTYLGLQGSFRVMSDGVSVATIGREGNSPIAGYVAIELHMPPGAEATFSGQFFVKAQIPVAYPILRGIGTIPNPPPGWTAENAVIWANFYAGPDKWFFHCGSPTNRGGLALELGGIRVAEITGYMMVGHDLPIVMPEPHSEFIRIFNRGMDTPESSVDGGDVNHLMAGQPRPSAPPTGSGFAFGVSMMFNIDLSFFPFYFDLTAVMGADINITESDSRHCAGSGRVPGVDGWYGTGQMYVAIEGEFGIRVDLFFIKGEFPILSASAALLVQGGMPNPEWAAGRGSFSYEILGGLIDGRCSFNLEVGEVCLPVVTGDPFGDLTLIQDLTPQNGETNVSIFVSPQAAFALPMDLVLEIPEYTSALDPPSIRYMKPYIKKFEHRLDLTTHALAAERRMLEENRISEILPTAALNAHAWYKAEVEVRAYDLEEPLMTATPVYVDGVEYKKRKIHRFQTGAAPPTLVEENIYFTYPYIKQQNFMKHETDAGKGYVRLVQGRPDLLATQGEFEVNEVSFIARFTSEEGDTIETNMTVSDYYRLLTFDVSRLENNQIYCVQLIRKDVPPSNDNPNQINAGILATLNNTYNPNLSGLMNSYQIANFNALVGASTVGSGVIKRVNLPENKVNAYEKEIYNYYFRTSEYNTMQEKLDNGDWTTNMQNFWGFDVPNRERALEEKLEWVDVENFKVVNYHRAKQFGKRVDFYLRKPGFDEFDDLAGRGIDVNSYMQYKVNPNMPGVRTQLTSIANRTAYVHGGLFNSIIRNVPNYRYEDYSKNIRVDTRSPIKNKLADWAIQNAFTEIIETGGSSSGSPLASGLNIGNAGLGGSGFSGISGIGISSLFTSQIQFTPAPTIVNYHIHVNGWNQFRLWQQSVASYAYQDLRLMGMISLGSIVNNMSPTDRQYVNTVLSREPVNRMRLNYGSHKFGVYYKYPDSAGNDRKGSIYQMNIYR